MDSIVVSVGRDFWGTCSSFSPRESSLPARRMKLGRTKQLVAMHSCILKPRQRQTSHPWQRVDDIPWAPRISQGTKASGFAQWVSDLLKLRRKRTRVPPLHDRGERAALCWAHLLGPWLCAPMGAFHQQAAPAGPISRAGPHEHRACSLSPKDSGSHVKCRPALRACSLPAGSVWGQSSLLSQDNRKWFLHLTTMKYSCI